MSCAVKICGITRLQDALAAAALGADELGFNFVPGSRRHLAPREAAAIISRLPPGVLPVGIFVDAAAEAIATAVRESGVAAVQLHGHEAPGAVAAIPGRVIKALPASASLVREMERYDVDAFLIDGAAGGSGRTFDWALAQRLPRAARLYLAGGLDPLNVAEAISRVHPDVVDVASGVEDAPGIKNEQLMARFIRAAKEIR